MAVVPPTEQWLADGADGLGQESLGHHDALEEVGCLADDDGVDVVHRELGVGERPVDGLPEKTGE
jgi:hypothetical protein